MMLETENLELLSYEISSFWGEFLMSTFELYLGLDILATNEKNLFTITILPLFDSHKGLLVTIETNIYWDPMECGAS